MHQCRYRKILFYGPLVHPAAIRSFYGHREIASHNERSLQKIYKEHGLSINLTIYASTYISMQLSINLTVTLPTYLSTYPTITLLCNLSIYPTVNAPSCHFIARPIFLTIFLSIRLLIYILTYLTTNQSK